MHLFVDNLTNVDFSYLHPQRGLLGETWLASTQLEGSLDHQGMVCDFGVVKKTLRNWLDDEIDHRLVVPVNSPNLTFQERGDQIQLTWKFGDKSLTCSSPRQAIALVDAEEITPESVSQWSRTQLQALLPETLDSLGLDFQHEAIAGDFYHYSHGLKKHNGNCQRIAHGHRSQIRIWRNDQPAPDLEAQWAQRFEDIYIGTREDIIKQESHRILFAYTTSQGAFELDMPETSCYLIDTDTTVELIADHLADQLKQQHPNDKITVKAYEGMGKGAVVIR
ncbi:6-carboxytetrahydropterin synthase [Aestuariicella sp. G3-2]|uniref:6-carboxytetrahydropterin synthase n=1 Tax=Pseudomaricurvus albidus TaxID=2842452 RepID=UPI001C0E6859|nr:6-carboxytetrahydropterin synthase [Aestuariicella albida]MBU3069903.1 6-carboxytetrahydropterin synthase [Aestuariicella albida]